MAKASGEQPDYFEPVRGPRPQLGQSKLLTKERKQLLWDVATAIIVGACLLTIFLLGMVIEAEYAILNS